MTTVLVVLLLLLAGIAVYLLAAGPKLPPETDAVIAGVMGGALPEFIQGQTGFADSGGLQIWYECISPPAEPKGTVLLLMANGGDALIWPPKFVRAFVEAGYQVIRYDHRGTGMSDWVADWDRKHPYSLADMAGDAVAVLDALRVPAAHLVGLSLGGMVAQEIAIRHPARAASLTLMMTSGDVGDPHLPGLSSSTFFKFALRGLPLLKYRLMGGEKNLIKERLAKELLMLSPGGLDIQETARAVLYDLRKRRGINWKAAMQHQAAVTVSGPRYAALKSLALPALVVHGTQDELIPVQHGQKLVRTIPNAKGVWLEGVGHIFPPPDLPGLMEKIIAHLDGAAA